MPSYDSFMCPNCEHHFRVIWPEALPSHYHPCSKIKMKCPDCNEVTELYDFLIDRITQPPDPSIPTVDVLSISPRDLNPDANARSNLWLANYYFHPRFLRIPRPATILRCAIRWFFSSISLLPWSACSDLAVSVPSLRSRFSSNTNS